MLYFPNRALKTKGNTPKYGLIFHSTFIGRAAAKNKGRISRYLANKCTIASRIDCFSGEWQLIGIFSLIPEHAQWHIGNDAKHFSSTVFIPRVGGDKLIPEHSHITISTSSVHRRLLFKLLLNVLSQMCLQVCTVTSCVDRWRSACLSMKPVTCHGRMWMSWRRLSKRWIKQEVDLLL